MITILCSLGGAGLGFGLGLFYGYATDNSDFPIAAAFTGPIGGVIGAISGTIIGVALS